MHCPQIRTSAQRHMRNHGHIASRHFPVRLLLTTEFSEGDEQVLIELMVSEFQPRAKIRYRKSQD